MKSVWVTVIIVITWIATTITILSQPETNVVADIILAFAATFYLIIFGLQAKQID